jgi:hypothetical protein
MRCIELSMVNLGSEFPAPNPPHLGVCLLASDFCQGFRLNIGNAKHCRNEALQDFEDQIKEE